METTKQHFCPFAKEMKFCEYCKLWRAEQQNCSLAVIADSLNALANDERKSIHTAAQIISSPINGIWGEMRDRY